MTVEDTSRPAASMPGPAVLVIDDLRSFAFDAVYARSSMAALAVLERDGGWDEVWFDHDLGGADTTIPVLDRVAELAFDGTPLRVAQMVVHTSNPAGRATLVRVLRRWGYDVVCVDAAAHVVGR
jgi:hypothetical protein